MYFVIFGTDKPGMLATREEVRPQHRQYLRQPGTHAVKVLLGGPTLTAEQTGMNGSLLVVEADTLEQVEAFVRDDPYWAADIFAELHIRPWNCGLGSPVGGEA